MDHSRLWKPTPESPRRGPVAGRSRRFTTGSADRGYPSVVAASMPDQHVIGMAGAGMQRDARSCWKATSGVTQGERESRRSATGGTVGEAPAHPYLTPSISGQ
jgi:hypothetical protein